MVRGERDGEDEKDDGGSITGVAGRLVVRDGGRAVIGLGVTAVVLGRVLLLLSLLMSLILSLLLLWLLLS